MERSRALHICVLAHLNESHADDLYQKLHDALEPGATPEIIAFPDGSGALKRYDSGTTISLIDPRWGSARSHEARFDASIEAQLIHFVNTLTPFPTPCSAVELLMCRLTGFDCHVIVVGPPLHSPRLRQLHAAPPGVPPDGDTPNVVVAEPTAGAEAVEDGRGGGASFVGGSPVAGGGGDDDGGFGSGGEAMLRGGCEVAGASVGATGGVVADDDSLNTTLPGESPPHIPPHPQPSAGTSATAAAASLLEAACARLQLAPLGAPTADAVAAVAAHVRAEAADARQRRDVAWAPRAHAAGEAWAARVLRPWEEVFFGAVSPAGSATTTHHSGGWAVTFARAGAGAAWGVTLRRPAAEPVAVREIYSVRAVLHLQRRRRGDREVRLIIPAGAAEGEVRGWVHDGEGVLRVRAIFETEKEGRLKAEGAALWADVGV